MVSSWIALLSLNTSDILLTKHEIKAGIKLNHMENHNHIELPQNKFH